MKILLTGSGGMLGKNVVEHRKYLNYEFYTPSSNELNLLVKDQIVEYLNKNRIEFIVHCAGLVGGILVNSKNSFEFFSKNLLMGMNIINAATLCDVRQILNLGSSCMYPKDYKHPLKEEYILNAPLEPTNEGYALAKISVAKMCEYACMQYGYEYKTLIPCNLYGKWDKFEEHVSHLLPAIIKKVHDAKLNSKTVEIWGDGMARRELMYAEDCADAIFFAIENFHRLPLYTNIGLGYDYSINEYYSIVADIIGYKGKFFHDLTKLVGMKQKLLDITKISQLGWKPFYSLEVGIGKTYDFYLNRINNE